LVENGTVTVQLMNHESSYLAWPVSLAGLCDSFITDFFLSLLAQSAEADEAELSGYNISILCEMLFSTAIVSFILDNLTVRTV